MELRNGYVLDDDTLHLWHGGELLGRCSGWQEVFLMYLLHRHHGTMGVDAFDMLKFYLPKRRYELKPRWDYNPAMVDESKSVTVIGKWAYGKFDMYHLKVEHFVMGETFYEWLVTHEGWPSTALTVGSYDMAAAVLAGFPYSGANNGLFDILRLMVGDG